MSNSPTDDVDNVDIPTQDGRQNGQIKRRGRPRVPADDVRCTARSKVRMRGNDPDPRCRNYRAVGFTVCEDHGAAAQVGLAHHSTTHGRYSRVMPKKLTERFEALVTDPDVLNLSRDLALLDTRLEQLLTRIDENESEADWRRAGDAYRKLRAAMTSGDGAGITDALTALGRAFSSASAVDSNWRDIRDALQERRLIVESERRRLVDLHQMVTVEELMVFASALVSIVNQEVPDPRIRTSIALKVRGLLGRSGRPIVTTPGAIDGQATTVGARNGDGS
jgi:hypothetical protein